MTPEPPDAGRLLSRLLGPPGPELTCEQCFEQLDRYVELQRAHVDADDRVPGMRAHLIGCPACADDYESLHAFLTEHDGDAGPPPTAGPSDVSV